MHFLFPFSDLGLPKFDNHSGVPVMNVFKLNIRKWSHLQSAWNQLLYWKGVSDWILIYWVMCVFKKKKKKTSLDLIKLHYVCENNINSSFRRTYWQWKREARGNVVEDMPAG